MAISYPISFPTINNTSIIQKMTMRLIHSVAMTESPYTYKQQTHDFGGSRWEAEITIRPLTESEGKEFSAFLAALKGRKGTFTVGNPLHTATTPSDIDTSSLKSKGSTNIVLDNASATPLAAGDHFSINNKLYMALEAVAGNSTSTTIDITPPLREDVSGGTSAITDNPVGIWRLADNEVEWDISRAGKYSFTIACVEALT